MTVGEHDFEYRGARFPSLSKLALAITGTVWNGFTFFKVPKVNREASGATA